MSHSVTPTPPGGHAGSSSEALAAYGIAALEDDPELAAICAFAARLLGAATAQVSLIDDEHERILAGTEVTLRLVARKDSLCARALDFPGLVVATDLSGDTRFGELPEGTSAGFYAGVPLISPEGATLGALCVMDPAPRHEGLDPLQQQGLEVLAQAVMRRLGHRREGLAREREMAATLRRIARMADGIPAIAWTCTPALEFDFYNARWREFTGAEPPRETEGWREFVHPDDAEAAFGTWARVCHTGEPFESEYRMRHASGEWRWVLSRAAPMLDENGAIERWFGTVTDVHDQRETSEQRDLLARELSHRIKNIFAVIAGLVALRSRQHPEAGTFAEELADAIAALGRAHDYVRPLGGRHGDRLHGLMIDLMIPYGGAGDGRVRCLGEDCRLSERAATPLALVFHELATNSAKYGALSVPHGHVTITTSVDHSGGMVQIDWLEQAGPPPTAQAHEGFGSRLIRLAVEGQLRGTMERRWLDDGVAATVTVPLAALQG